MSYLARKICVSREEEQMCFEKDATGDLPSFCRLLIARRCCSKTLVGLCWLSNFLFGSLPQYAIYAPSCSLHVYVNASV